MHGLRAYTLAEQKAVRAAAFGFPREPDSFDSAEALLELGTGEALVSLRTRWPRAWCEQEGAAAGMPHGGSSKWRRWRRSVAQAKLVEKYGRGRLTAKAPMRNLPPEKSAAAEADALAAERAQLEKKRAELEEAEGRRSDRAAKAAAKEAESGRRLRRGRKRPSAPRRPLRMKPNAARGCWEKQR